MTSYIYTLFVLAFVIVGVHLAYGQEQKTVLFIERLGENCQHNLQVYRHFQVGMKGFYLMECNPEKYLKCKEQLEGGWTCQCAFEPEDYDPNLCKKPPPSRDFGELCSLLETCRKPYVCPNDEKSVSTCRCPADTPLHNEEKRTCNKYGYEDTCAVTTSPNVCVGNCVCSGGKCTCPAGLPNWNPDHAKCQGASHGEACDDKIQCHTGAGLSCEAGKCECKNPKKPNWNPDRKECDGKLYNEACTRDSTDECMAILTCYGEKCNCGHTSATYDEATKSCVNKPKFGEHCDFKDPALNVLECSDPSLICGSKESLCICKYEWQGPDSTKSKCVTKLTHSTFGGTCSQDADCLSGAKLNCTGNICSCASDRLWNEIECELKSKMKKCDPTEKIPAGACFNPIGENSECDEKEKLCRCASNAVYVLWAKGCKLKSGEDCSFEGIKYHDLCASQECGKDGKCACPLQNDALPKVMSSEPGEGCILNFQGHPCHEDNDCNPSAKKNASRALLICNPETSRCECGSGLSYSQGYCIRTNMTFGDTKCDRRFGRSCAMDTLTTLSCVENKGTYSCVCLPKPMLDRFTGGKNVKVATEWDEVEKKCALKNIGSKCVKGYECRSGICSSKGLCVPKPRKRSGVGKPLQGPATSVLAVLVYLYFKTY